MKTKLFSKLLLLLNINFSFLLGNEDRVTIAILAKDKEHCLPYYLKCLENQTFAKKNTFIYIRTNNNNDKTAEVLKNWVDKVKHEYAEIFFDASDVIQKVEQFRPHEWNSTRFHVLGEIRQQSIEWAKSKGTHYFVADCDNFIKPHVIETLLKSEKPVVGPLLKISHNLLYSNFHHATTENGYFKESPEYYAIWSQTNPSIHPVDVIHCTYLIRNEILHAVHYQDGTDDYEYVIFSRALRNKGIQQYIDNRELYGWITMADNEYDLKSHSWFQQLQ